MKNNGRSDQAGLSSLYLPSPILILRLRSGQAKEGKEQAESVNELVNIYNFPTFPPLVIPDIFNRESSVFVFPSFVKRTTLDSRLRGNDSKLLGYTHG